MSLWVVNVLVDFCMFLWLAKGSFDPCSIWILQKLYENVYCVVENLLL